MQVLDTLEDCFADFGDDFGLNFGIFVDQLVQSGPFFQFLHHIKLVLRLKALPVRTDVL
jgi:hypothetical protein